MNPRDTDGRDRPEEATDRLVGWVADFLWCWEQSSVLHGEAARALISALIPAGVSQADQPPRKAAQDLLREIEDPRG